MIWHLLAVFISGLVIGSLAFLLRKITRNKLPKWIIPVAAGVGMLCYQAYYNYTWYDFKKSQLPEEAVILDEKRTSDFFRPWSYLLPAVNYFSFIDGDFRSYKQDDDYLVQYIRYELYQDYIDRLKNHTYVLNCTKKIQIRLDEDGETHLPIKAEQIDPKGILYQELCNKSP